MVLKKRLRLRPGSHEIALKTEERSSAKVKVELVGGRIRDLRFEPVYGRKSGLRGTFGQGLRGYKVYLDWEDISKR